jgi:hypothetical protein
MASPELSAFAAITYTAIQMAYIAATATTLALHIIGRHENCVRNFVITASLAASSLLATGMKTYFTAQLLTQAVEATAYMAMLITPLLLLLSKLYQLNNREARAAQKRHGKTTAGLKRAQSQRPATRQEPNPAATYILQEMKPAQPPPPQAPAQKPSAPPTPLPTIYRPHPPTSTAWNIARNTGTPPKPAKHPGKTAAKKNRPKIEDIIHSPEYAQPLGRILVKTLREGVRYNGKLYRLHLTFIRQQDIIYIWQLGKKRKKQPITERAGHRLNNLQLVKLSKKVRQGEGGAQTAEVAELTEKGWAARNAIAKAAQKILEKKAAEIATTHA